MNITDINLNNINEVKEELLKLFQSFNKIGDIYEYFNIRDNSKNVKLIHNIADKIGFDFKYYKEKKHPKKYCLNCGKELTGYQKKFCCKSCATSYNNKLRNPEVYQKTAESLRKLYNKKASKPKYKKEKSKSIKKIKICEVCGKEFAKDTRFCSRECANKFNSINNYQKRKIDYKYYLTHPEGYNRPNYIPKKFRQFFLEE